MEANKKVVDKDLALELDEALERVRAIESRAAAAFDPIPVECIWRDQCYYCLDPVWGWVEQECDA
ncbi:MAG TPA: hypothetical protein VFR28_04360 [Allosphingosinicella sp.]|jgi:hypothetical protein|nr:hypothetical protein [Allosphingosinicella sp.]